MRLLILFIFIFTNSIVISFPSDQFLEENTLKKHPNKIKIPFCQKNIDLHKFKTKLSSLPQIINECLHKIPDLQPFEKSLYQESLDTRTYSESKDKIAETPLCREVKGIHKIETKLSSVSQVIDEYLHDIQDPHHPGEYLSKEKIKHLPYIRVIKELGYGQIQIQYKIHEEYIDSSDSLIGFFPYTIDIYNNPISGYRIIEKR